MKKTTVLAVVLILSSHSTWAAGEGVRDMFASPYFYIGLGLFIFLAFTFFILRYAFATMKEATLKAQGRWEEYQEKQVEEEGALLRSLTAAVPVEEEESILTDHDYDGIQELDNRLPPWWLWGFYISIAFAIGYMVHFHVTGNGLSSQEELELAYEEWNAELEAKMASGAIVELNPDSLQVLTDQASLDYGRSILNGGCTSCHGNNGAGASGPNLTDEYWIHGGDLASVFTTIKYGVPEKGMLAWKSSYTDEKIHKIASYILSLQGTNPSDGKAPQGELWVPETQEEAPLAETPETEE
ncbi:MAG: c-type cytochrome [Flavobacteriia bacterium]|nr:c-type cytochrome [Flavobacteriia bacterium]